MGFYDEKWGFENYAQGSSEELTDAAHKAARLTDTDAHIQTASRAYTRPLWYQSRVWDPDD